MDKKQLEQMADTIETTLAQRDAPVKITGGTVTPLWVRFAAIPKNGTKPSTIRESVQALSEVLEADRVEVARRGATVEVTVIRSEPGPVPLKSLLDQLDDIPPLTATLGLAYDGAPLLARFPSPVVGNVLAPVTLFNTIAASLLVANGELQLIHGAGALDTLNSVLWTLENKRGNGQAIFAFLGSTDGLTADLLRCCQSVGVYVVAAGDGDGLPFGLRISDGCNGGMVAQCDGKSYSFAPATIADRHVLALAGEAVAVA